MTINNKQSENNGKKYNIFIIFAVFIILYYPPILSFNSMHLVGVLSIAYLVIKGVWKLDNKSARLVCFFALIAIYLLCVCVLVYGKAITSVVFPLYYLLDIIPFSLAVKHYMGQRMFADDFFIKQVFVAAILQSILAVIAFFDHSVQQMFVGRIIAYGGIETYNYWSTLRMYGFAGGLFFDTPAIQSILAILAFYLSSKYGVKYICIGLLFFLTAIVNARTSFIVMFVGLIVLVLCGKASIKRKFQLVIGIVMAVVIVFLIGLPIIEKISPLTHTWLMDGLSQIIETFSGGGRVGYFAYFNNKSRYTLPSDPLGFLFGKGISVFGGNNQYGIESDIGYIIDFWIGGLVYVAFVYLGIFKRMWEMYRSKDRLVSFLGVFLTVMILLLNIKGRVFYMSAILNFAIMMYIISLSEDKSHER